jgi:hypothetical protein
MFDRPIIHVGLEHSGTTSLQQNIFSKRSDLFYAGVPYSNSGGIFSFVKYLEPERYDHIATATLRDKLIFGKMSPRQHLVISDETLVEQPSIYYTPPMMPNKIIAERLQRLFGQCVVLFTLRNQYHYVLSNYALLQANYASLAKCQIEPFDTWFRGNRTQVRNLFLRNLDPSSAIEAYQSVFGADAVHVLPLELLSEQGTKAYLDRLGQIIGRKFSSIDVENYVSRDVSPPPSLILSKEQRAIIQRVAGAGNAFVADQFKVPLRDYGYPMPDMIRRSLPYLRRLKKVLRQTFTGSAPSWKAGRPASMYNRSNVYRAVIHVGFGHSGTTSLQQNIFSKRSDLFYAGVPYGSVGAIFSPVKYLEPERYDHILMARLCDKLIFRKMSRSQGLIISDETLVDQPAIYYTPSMMPIKMIAERLHRLFGQCLVLLTLRNQYQYVLSNYSVLKTNYASLANRQIEPFDTWFRGNRTQVRNLFLRNLDPSYVIKAYQSVFGADAVHVLPLELLSQHGARAYLDRLGQIIGREFSSVEVENYVAHNVSTPNDLILSDEQRTIIHNAASAGNAFVADQFKEPLRDYGYPMPD